MIANTLRSVFGELLCVPHYKGDLSPFDICANDRKMYLTGKSFQQYISYYTHEYYDGTTAEVLDYVKSPVLEYRVPFQREDMAYIAGRFYCLYLSAAERYEIPCGDCRGHDGDLIYPL